MNESTHLWLYTINLTFICSNIFGWLIKCFYRPKVYRDNFDGYFPAQTTVTALYLVQVFEIPYLLNIGGAASLFYINTFALLVFPALMIEMYDEYFFLKKHTPLQRVLHYLPAAIPSLLLLVGVFVPRWFSIGIDTWIGNAVMLIFSYYFTITLGIAVKLRRTVRKLNEMSYSNPGDFPARLAQKVMWLAVGMCVILLVNFVCAAPWVKAVRDLIFTVINVWFLLITLDPWRTAIFTDEEQTLIKEMEENTPTAFRMNEHRYKELSASLGTLMNDEKVYCDPHISMEVLVERLGTNRNYLCETIKRNGYKSFYDMVNRHRVEMAITLIRQMPDCKIYLIAEQCGFSSASYMNKMFRIYNRESPTAFKQQSVS